MEKVFNIPVYVLDPAYKMKFIIAARTKKGWLQYRQCFTSKAGALKKLKVSQKRNPDIEFHMFSIDELNY